MEGEQPPDVDHESEQEHDRAAPDEWRERRIAPDQPQPDDLAFEQPAEQESRDEEQRRREAHAGMAQLRHRAVKSVAVVTRRQLSASSSAAWSTSARLTISFGECMYRFGSDTSAVATPSRAM